MKRISQVILQILLLLVLYYALQVLFLTLSQWVTIYIASHAGSIPADAGEFIGDAQYLKAHPAVHNCLVTARAVAIILSSLSMLLFIHLRGLYKLRWGLLRSLDTKPLLISTLLVFSSMFALNIFVQWFPLDDNLDGIFEGLSRNPLGILGLAVLAPLLEEVLFRGAIQGTLMRFFGRPWPAIIVAALIFGIFHWNPVQVVYATLLGVIFGWIYYRTGSLLSVIVGHILNNTFAVISTVAYSNADEAALAGGSPGIAAFLFFALVSAYLVWQLDRTMRECSNRQVQ